MVFKLLFLNDIYFIRIFKRIFHVMKKLLIIIVTISGLYAQCLGDLNQDNVIDILDIILVVNIILGDEVAGELSDINYDNITNILDIIILVNIILDNVNSCEIMWGEETSALPDYYYSDDVGDSQINDVVEYYNIAKESWGNYGPLEFWVIGTNIFAAAELDEYYCELRLEKDPCLGDDFLQWCLNREYSFVDYAMYGGAGLSLRRENHWNCEGYSYLEITLASQYPFPDESDYNVVTMHEYFHAYQMAHISTYDQNERADLMVVNPWWSEGGAEYMAQLLYSQQNGVYDNYLKDRMSWKMESKDDLFENEFISEIPYSNRAYIAYDLGAWAIAYLISIVGIEAYRVDFYNSLNEHGWENSFSINFNMTSNEFLIDFHEFLQLSIQEQLTIIP